MGGSFEPPNLIIKPHKSQNYEKNHKTTKDEKAKGSRAKNG